MIINIRKALQGNQYVLIGIAVVMGIVFLLPPSLQKGGRAEYPPIATVNGYEIPYEEFARSMRSQQEYVALLRAQYGQFADDFLKKLGLNDAKKLQAHVYDSLIRQTLIEQFAQALKFQLNPDYIKMILNDPEMAPRIFANILPHAIFDEMGTINMHALQSYLRQVGMTIADFEEKVEGILKTRTAFEIIDSGLYVPQFYLQEQYKMNMVSKKFSIAIIDKDVFVAAEKKEVIQPEELQAFFDKENTVRQRYFIPEKRMGKMWEFSSHTYGINVDDAAIKAYYDEYKVRKYLEKATQVQVRRIVCAVSNEDQTQFVYDKVKQIRAEIVSEPHRFASIAQEVSDDKSSAKNGGLVPLFAKEDREKEFSKASFMLQKEGDISEVFKTKDGFEIVQLVARQQPVYKDLKVVYADIKKDLMQKRFEQEFAADMQKVAHGTESIEQFVQTRGAKLGSTGLIELGDTKVSLKLFGLSKSEGNNVAFYVEVDKGFAIQLEEVQERHLADLSSVKNVVMNDLYETRAAKAMTTFLDKAQKELQQGAVLKNVVAPYQGKIEHTASINSSDTEALQKLQNRGLPADRMVRLLQEGAVLVNQTSENGYIMRLDHMDSIDQESFTAVQKQLMHTTRRDIQRVYNDAFVASLQRTATIKPNENINTASR